MVINNGDLMVIQWWLMDINNRQMMIDGIYYP